MDDDAGWAEDVDEDEDDNDTGEDKFLEGPFGGPGMMLPLARGNVSSSTVLGKVCCKEYKMAANYKFTLITNKQTFVCTNKKKIE